MELIELIEQLSGVTISNLTPVETPKSRIWRVYGMKCVDCGASWDTRRLERHHFISRKVGKVLGLSMQQLNNPLNYKVLCQKCHNSRDVNFRKQLAIYYPDFYRQVYKLELSGQVEAREARQP